MGPKPAFSENENRYLQKQPEISVSAIAEGHFENRRKLIFPITLPDANPGLPPHLTFYPFPEFPTSTAPICAQTAGWYRESQKANLTGTDTEKTCKEIADFHSTCAEKEIPVTLMTVPTAASVYKDRSPVHAVRFDESSAFAEAKKYAAGRFS